MESQPAGPAVSPTTGESLIRLEPHKPNSRKRVGLGDPWEQHFRDALLNDPNLSVTAWHAQNKDILELPSRMTVLRTRDFIMKYPAEPAEKPWLVQLRADVLREPTLNLTAWRAKYRTQFRVPCWAILSKMRRQLRPDGPVDARFGNPWRGQGMLLTRELEQKILDEFKGHQDQYQQADHIHRRPLMDMIHRVLKSESDAETYTRYAEGVRRSWWLRGFLRRHRLGKFAVRKQVGLEVEAVGTDVASDTDTEEGDDLDSPPSEPEPAQGATHSSLRCFEVLEPDSPSASGSWHIESEDEENESDDNQEEVEAEVADVETDPEWVGAPVRPPAAIRRSTRLALAHPPPPPDEPPVPAPLGTCSRFYAVRVGRKRGVFMDWASYEKQVHGFAGAEHMSFRSLAQALRYVYPPEDEEQVSAGAKRPAPAAGADSAPQPKRRRVSPPAAERQSVFARNTR